MWDRFGGRSPKYQQPQRLKSSGSGLGSRWAGSLGLFVGRRQYAAVDKKTRENIFRSNVSENVGWGLEGGRGWRRQAIASRHASAGRN